MPDQRSLAQLLRLGSAQREDALLQAQMQQAADLARPRGRQYGTAGGAIMGGLGDAIREMGGGFRQNDLARQAKEAMAGEVDARQQWITADAQKRAAARAALLRGQQPPAEGMPLEQSLQEQAAGMAAALRRQAVAQDIARLKSGTAGAAPMPTAPAPDAITAMAPYQPGPVIGAGGGMTQAQAAREFAEGRRLAAYLATPGATYPPPAGFYAAPSSPSGRLSMSAGTPGTPAAPLAPLAGPAGQVGGSAPIGNQLRALVSGPVNTPMPSGQMSSPAVAQPKMSTPAVAPPAPAQAELPDLSPDQFAEIAIASGDPAMMAWGKSVLERSDLRATLDAKRQEQEAKIKGDADAAAAKKKGEADKFGHEQRDKLMAIPMIRSAMDSRAALDQIQLAASQKSAMGDIAMVYGVITTFDPKSGVKEGEIGLTAEAQGFVNKLESTFQRLKDGARLTDTVRQDILNTAKNMYLARSAPALKLASEYDGYLARAGLNPKEYLPDLGFSSTPKTPKAKPAPPSEVERDGRRFVRQADGTYEEAE